MAADLIVRIFFHGLIAFNPGIASGEAYLLKTEGHEVVPHHPEILWNAEHCRSDDTPCRNQSWKPLGNRIVRFEWIYQDQEPPKDYTPPPAGPPPDANDNGFPCAGEFQDFRWLVDINELAENATPNGATNPITSTIVFDTGQLASCKQVAYKDVSDGDKEKLFVVTFPYHTFGRSITEVATLTMGPATALGIKIKLSPGNVEVVLVGEKCGNDRCVDIVVQNAPVPTGRKPQAPHFNLFRDLFDNTPKELVAELDMNKIGPSPYECTRYEHFEELVRARDRERDRRMAEKSRGWPESVLDRPICPLTKF